MMTDHNPPNIHNAAPAVGGERQSHAIEDRKSSQKVRWRTSTTPS
jgi:hypothetical protein